MSCNSPNKVFYTGINPDTGKKKIVFASRKVDYIARIREDEPWEQYAGDPSALKALGFDVITNSDLVPCGQCLGCRLDYARTWACRMMLESEHYPKDEVWFVTCTYNDENLPDRGEAVRLDTGELVDSPFYPLSKKDHQDFVKRVRKHYGSGIRYCVSGEYGDTTYRPHYHYVFFGLKLNDLIKHANNWRGDPYFVSPTLSAIWGKGFVTIGRIEFDTCNYVARYVLKKQKGKNADMYEKLGIEPEFFLMSRRPGIGKEYFDENYEAIYENDEIVLPSRDGAFVTKVPKYFDTLLEKVNVDEYRRVTGNRKINAIEMQETTKALFPFVDEEDVFSSRERKLSQKVVLKKKGIL